MKPYLVVDRELSEMCVHEPNYNLVMENTITNEQQQYICGR